MNFHVSGLSQRRSGASPLVEIQQAAAGSGRCVCTGVMSALLLFQVLTKFLSKSDLCEELIAL